MKKNVPPGVVILVIAVLVIVVALWFWKGTSGGVGGTTAKRMERAGRKMPSIDASGKLVMKEMPMNEPGAAKKAVTIELPKK